MRSAIGALDFTTVFGEDLSTITLLPRAKEGAKEMKGASLISIPSPNKEEFEGITFKIQQPGPAEDE